jgi:hypothetical protein
MSGAEQTEAERPSSISARDCLAAAQTQLQLAQLALAQLNAREYEAALDIERRRRLKQSRPFLVERLLGSRVSGAEAVARARNACGLAPRRSLRPVLASGGPS